MQREQLQTTPLEVQRVLQSFGQLADGCSTILLLTDMGMPKYIVQLKNGSRLFLGSIFGDSKDKSNVLASMRAANSAADCVPASVSIGGYLMTASGQLLVEGDQGRRWMLVPFFEEKQPLESDKYTPMSECSYRLPATLGALHTAFRESGASIEGLKYYSAVTGLQQAWENLQSAMSSTSALPIELRPVLQPVERCLAQLQEKGVATLDALPRQVIHSDFQPKNLILSPEGSQIRICDTETMTQGPRLYDLLFLLMGSDDGEFIGKWEAKVDRLEEYLVAAWPLSPEEVDATPIALAHLASGIAAWAASKFERPGSFPLERLRQITVSFSEATKELSDYERVRNCCYLANCFAAGPAVGLDDYTAYFHGTKDVCIALQGLPVLATGQQGAAIFFNGTFSPVHAGHMATADLAVAAVKELGFDYAQTVFSPCHDSHEAGKLKQLSVGVEHRSAMLQAAEGVVDLFEAQRDTATMDLEGVQSAFVRRLPVNYKAFYLVGADVASWRWLRRKLALGLHVLLIVNRPGLESRIQVCQQGFQSHPWPGSLHIVCGEQTGKSSTRIRAVAASGGNLEAEVGIPKVAAYIAQHQLYKPASSRSWAVQ